MGVLALWEPCVGSFGVSPSFDFVLAVNGGILRVVPFDGTDRVNTDNLTIASVDSMLVDATSQIDARGTGYQTSRCVGTRRTGVG